MGIAFLQASVLLRLLRSRFSEEHVEVAARLIALAPNIERHSKRLPVAAYKKGLIAGLSYDSMDGKYPDCPYDARQLPNFMRGENDPRTAWRDGSRDGIRIQDIINRPERVLVPALLQSEFRVLPPDLKTAHERKEGAS